MKVTVTCPDTNQPVTYNVGSIQTKHLFKILNKAPQIIQSLGATGGIPTEASSMLVTLITGNMLNILLTEGLDIVADLIKKDKEYVERLDMADLIELITATIEETDFEKLGKAIKKLMEVAIKRVPQSKQE